MAQRKDVMISDFYCTICGNKGIPIARKVGSHREAGHLKKLYCLYCGKETNHCEIRPYGSYTYEDFQKEFTLGRFLEDGTRVPSKDLTKCSNKKCDYNEGGNCWNSDNSYRCPHRRYDDEK